MTRIPKDIGASVRARLLLRSRSRGEDFQLLLLRYANERLLYRLCKSPHGSRFVLKGATLFALWMGDPHRATRDVDLLGFGDPTESCIRAVFADVLTLDVEDDGVRFDLESLTVGPIREEKEYGGVRAVLVARVSNAEVRLQVDIGFGDAITPEATTIDLPPLLEFPAPRLRVYPSETVVAEKLETIVLLGIANSRMKDFCDLVVLSQAFSFSGSILVRAIRATFNRRETPNPKAPPAAFTDEFTNDHAKNIQWTAFLRKPGVSDSGDFARTVAIVAGFLGEPLQAAASSELSELEWQPGGGWS